MKLLAVTAAALAAAMPAHAVTFDTFTITFEAPGVQDSTIVTNLVGVERFTDRTSNVAFTNTFAPDFKVEYQATEILNANANGGAGGTGKYARVAPGASRSIKVNSTLGINYFGMYFSAFDPGNFVDFKRAGNIIYTFGPANVLALIGPCGTPAQQAVNDYCGNPDAGKPGIGTVANEPYAFVNFRNESGFFDEVVLRQASPINPNAGYQTDNHTFANVTIDPVPEPASWAMLIVGFGLVGGTMRRRQAAVAA